MPLKDLRSYMDQCRTAGTEPTWDGLRAYKDRKKAQANAQAEKREWGATVRRQ